MTVRRLAVLGAGTMGHGIAHAALVAGYETALYDVSQPALDRGCAAIEAIAAKGVEIGRMGAEEARAMLARLRSTTSLAEAVDGMDFVIEAAPERIAALDVRNNLLLIARRFPLRHALPFAWDWTKRYRLIAAANGRRRPHWRHERRCALDLELGARCDQPAGRPHGPPDRRLAGCLAHRAWEGAAENGADRRRGRRGRRRCDG